MISKVTLKKKAVRQLGVCLGAVAIETALAAPFPVMFVTLYLGFSFPTLMELKVDKSLD